MSAYTIQIKGTHPSQDDFTHEQAEEIATKLVASLEGVNNTVHHISINHGNLKGGTYDYFERIRVAKEKAAAEAEAAAQEPKSDASNSEEES